MVNWFTNLFRTKETLLVAVVRCDYTWTNRRLGIYDPKPGVMSAHLYEREDGQRRVDWSSDQDWDRMPTNIKNHHAWNMVKAWGRGETRLVYVPTYVGVKNGLNMVAQIKIEHLM